MNVIEKFYEDIKDKEIILPSFEPFLDEPKIDKLKYLPDVDGFITDELIFDDNVWNVEGFKLVTAQTNFKRYIKYTEFKIHKKFLGIKYHKFERSSDLEEIETLLKGFKYDVKFHPEMHVYFSWISYFIMKDNEIEEIDRKGHLEILRRIRRTKVNKLKSKTKERINKFL